MGVHVTEHPLIAHKLAILRNEETGCKEFRELIEEIASLICYEATRGLPLSEVSVKTPVCETTARMIIDRKFALVPILRAGIGMVEGMLKLMPTTKIGHIGLYRDPDTLEPVEYYCKLPIDIAERDVFLLDPMLATGGTASAAISFIKERGVKTISLLCVIACPEGIERLRKDHPDVDVYAASLDERLNEHGYIVPGLGDAGDRLFGTK
jgi:uracil phosphoribosyltransferase